MKEKRKKKNLT